MNARDVESMLLTRCTVVAGDAAQPAQDQREANVFRLAAMIVRSRFPREARRLMHASDQYFAMHPDERLAPNDIVKNGWVFSVPRLRDMLNHQFSGH